MRAVGVLLSACVAASAAQVTFHRDILPVLQRHCQGCHRPGEATPMAFLTYKETRPWAKAMREAVLMKRMPPWFADASHGKFRNDRSMPQKDIDTLVAWVDSGAPEGDPKDAPAPRPFVEGWNIGRPDLEFEMAAEYHVPAQGTIEYTYFVVPTNFKEDRWVQMAEVRPGNRAVVHHVIVFVREPGAKWLRNAKPGEPYVPPKNKEGRREEGEAGGEFLTGYAPGTVPEIVQDGRAKLVRAGSDLIFQMHYTANGKAAVDRTKVGLVFAKEPPRERVVTLAAMNRDFTIPAGASNHEVHAELEFASAVKLIGMLPHMHLRGKDFEYRAIYPTGENQVLLRVPRYSFNWQLAYYPEQEVLLPAGSKIACRAHFDNSANNPNNPDPSVDVKWGDQSWDEMMAGFMNVAVDANMDLKKLFPDRKKKANAD